MIGKCFRVTGFVNFINAGQRHCQIVHGNHSLVIDMTVVDFGLIRIDSLCQFIGEMMPSSMKVPVVL
jgi:hypothetical protein